MGKRLDGQTAIITGAGRGIGRAIAKELASIGANIVINYSTSADAASSLADEIRELGPQALVVQANITDYDQVTEMIRQTIDTFGQIDILVNNAGITRDKTLKNMSKQHWDTTKAGIIGFTKSVALEVSRHGITVNAVCPGFTETDMLMEVPEHIRQRILEKIPMGRFGKPEEIASCVRYIVTEGDYMTAQAISINGGVYV